jgi:hypothetical protein
MIVRIPALIYTGTLLQCHLRQISPFLLLAIYMAESTLRWDARGDWGPADPNRFAGDPYWLPDQLGRYPHSYGLGQLHVDGAGAGHPPAYLMDITNNLRLSAQFFRACLDATRWEWEDAISAYNQGIQGWRDRGRSFNGGYVNNVMQLYDVFARARLEVIGDVGGHWRVEVDK